MSNKRRILHALKITEISGVYRPCQEDAKVVLLKSVPDDEERVLALRKRVLAIRSTVVALRANSLGVK